MARVSQEEMDRRIAQYGGASLTHSPSVRTVKIKNPAFGMGEGQSFDAPQELTLAVQQWAGPNGALLEAYQLDDGSWEIEKETPGTRTATNPATQKPPGGSEGPEGTPTGQKDANGQDIYDNERPRWVVRDSKGTIVYVRPLEPAEEKQWRESRERSRNPGGKTDAEIKAEQPDRVGKPTGNTRTRSVNGTTVKETEYVLPDGTTAWRSQTEVGEPDRVGKPTGNTRARVENGQQIKEAEYVLPDGTKEWRTQTAPADTKDQPLPPDMPPFRPDPNKPGLGLVEYVQQLTALKSQRNPDGTPKLSDAQFTQFVNLAHQQATSEAGRLDAIQRAQQQQQTNAINQRNTDIQASVSRLNSANTATQNALETSQKMAAAFTPKSLASAGGPILPAILALQDQRANAWGGMQQPAPVTTAGYPMLEAVGQMGMPAPTGNTVIPALSQVQNMANPNQIGLGNIGSVVAPTGAAPRPAGAPDPAAAAAEAARQQAMAAGAARPVAPAPVAAPVAPPPAVAPVPPMSQQPRDDYMRPPAPVPVGAGGGNVQMPPPAVLPGVNTLGIMASLSGKYPPDVLQQAARELGML